jgi:hypothetical protein
MNGVRPSARFPSSVIDVEFRFGFEALLHQVLLAGIGAATLLKPFLARNVVYIRLSIRALEALLGGLAPPTFLRILE